MVKQRNIFDQNRIDILTDTNRELSTDQLQRMKEKIEADNEGVNVTIPKGNNMKPAQAGPEFIPSNQTNLF